MPCNHGISPKQIPILPKPAPTADPANIDVATSENASSKSNLSSLSIVVALTKSTPPVQNSGNMVTQGTTSLNESTLPISSSVNVIPQGQLPLSSETAIRPPVDSSFYMETQNQLPMSTSFVTGNTLMPPFQNSGNMVEQGPLQVSGTVNQPMLCTPSLQSLFNAIPSAVIHDVEHLMEISDDQGAPPIGDTNGNLDTNGNRNMLQAAETGSQMINEVISGLRHPYLATSTNATPLPNASGSDMWAQSTGLTTLANFDELVQREQYVDSIANSSNVQVLYIRYMYTVLFSICFLVSLKRR